MTINLQTLKCGECGSSALRRAGQNEYVCAHCGSVTVVEDDVSQRLDRVLDQVKDAAAGRLVAEQRMRQQQMLRVAAIAMGCVVGVSVLGGIVSAVFGTRGGSAVTARADLSVADRVIPVEKLRLSEPREVLVGSGGMARSRLLVTARNETGEALESPDIEAAFFGADGSQLRSTSESLPLRVLGPDESAPVLIDLPSGDTRAVRQTLAVQRLSAPFRAIPGPPLTFARMRLVQEGERSVRLVGRVVNPRKDATLGGVEALLVLYDGKGDTIGFGRGYAAATALPPGASTNMEVRVERFGGAATPVAAWDYRIGYSVVEASGARTTVVSPQRVVRTEGAPETLNPAWRMGTDELLADETERFDLSKLELLPLIPGFNTIRQRTYLTELVNRSADAIAVAPAATISRFDGNTLDGTTKVGGIAYLYPGERFPVQVEPNRADRIDQTRVEWKPLRKAALPGPRLPLVVKVESTRAEIGSVLLNFSQRFAYKSVKVTGTVTNPGTAIVKKPRIWVSLRDRGGQLTGFKLVDNLSALAPGESLPFAVDIEQQGRDFAKVETLYQTGE